MKKIFNTIVVVVTVISLLNSCKKTSVKPSLPQSGISNTPNFISVIITAEGKIQYLVMDLNHDLNKDKKYFVAEQVSSLSDSCRIVKGPYPIDSLALNWPAEIKHVSFGGGDLLFFHSDVDFIYRMGKGFRVVKIASESYYNWSWWSLYRSFVPRPTSIPSAYIEQFTQTSLVLYLFYFDRFNSHYYEYAHMQNHAKAPYPIADFCQGCGSLYDWSTVSSAISNGVGYGKVYFFDWTKWKFWYVRDVFNSERVAGLPQSLDAFVKWPAGWGKP